MKLSILMPVYNEETRLPEALKQALTVDYPCEVELESIHGLSAVKGVATLRSVRVARGARCRRG